MVEGNSNIENSYFVESQEFTENEMIRRLAEKIYFGDDTVAITIDGQIINLFNNSLFAIYRLVKNARPLMLRKSEMEEEALVEQKIEAFLTDAEQRIDYIARMLIMGFINRFFAILENDKSPEVQKQLAEAIYQILGLGETNEEAEKIDKIIATFHASELETARCMNGLYENLYPEAIRIFKSRILNIKTNLSNFIDSIKKLPTSSLIGTALKENISHEINKLFRNKYMRPVLTYLANHEHLIILVPYYVKDVDSILIYTAQNALAGGIRGFTLPEGDFACIPIVKNFEYEANFISPVPIIYGGIVQEIEMNSRGEYFVVDSFAKVFVEELNDFFYCELEKERLFSRESIIKFDLSVENIKKFATDLDILSQKIIDNKKLKSHEENIWQFIKNKEKEFSNKITAQYRMFFKKIDKGGSLEVGQEILLDETIYLGQKVEFVMEALYSSGRENYGLFKADPIKKDDPLVPAFVLKEISREILAVFDLVSTSYEASFYRQEIVGKIAVFLTSHGEIAEYIFAEVLPFFNNFSHMVDIPDTRNVYNANHSQESSLLNSNLQLLHEFLHNTYYGENTLVLDCFGNLGWLEDNKRMFYFMGNEYLLFRKDDLENNIRSQVLNFIKRTKDNVITLSAEITKQFLAMMYMQSSREKHKANIDVLTTKLSDFVDEQKNTDLMKMLKPLLKDAVYNNEELTPNQVGIKLAGLLSQDSQSDYIIGLVKKYQQGSFEANEFIFQYILSLKGIYEKISKAIDKMENEIEKYLHSITTMLETDRVSEETKSFVKAEILRIMDNSHAQLPFAIIANRKQTKIFLISDSIKLKKLLCWDPRNFSFGTVDIGGDGVVWLYLNPFINAYHHTSILGGFSIEQSFFQSYGKPETRIDIFSRSFIGTMSEEFYDYAYYLTEKRTNEAIENGLIQLEIALNKLPAEIQKQKRIADLILEEKEEYYLSEADLAIWKNIRQAMLMISKKIKMGPISQIRPIENNMEIGDWFTLSGEIPGIDIYTIVKRLVTSEMKHFFYQENLNLIKPLRIALLEAPAITPDFSHVEIASLCLSVIESIDDDFATMRENYPDAGFTEEMAGKLLRYYINYPGYIEITLPELDRAYLQLLRLLKPSEKTQVCSNGECTAYSEIRAVESEFLPKRQTFIKGSIGLPSMGKSPENLNKAIAISDNQLVKTEDSSSNFFQGIQKPNFVSSVLFYRTFWQMIKNTWQNFTFQFSSPETTTMEFSFDKAVLEQRINNVARKALPYSFKVNEAQDDLRWHIDDLREDLERIETKADLDNFLITLEDAERRVQNYERNGYRFMNNHSSIFFSETNQCLNTSLFVLDSKYNQTETCSLLPEYPVQQVLGK